IAARVRHDTERAVLAAALHDRNERRRAFGTRRRERIELLDFGEADIDDRAAVALDFVDHCRQTVQGLRSEHEVDVRRPPGDAVPFLARYASAHADEDMGLRLLELFPAAKLREHLLLRLLAHG